MMRKISDLFSRGEAADEIEREDLEGGVAAMIDYRIKGEGIDQMELIEAFYKLIDFPRSMRDGNLAHISGIAGDEIIFTSIWDNEVNASESYAELGPAIAEVIDRYGTPGTVVDRRSSGVHRFSIGESVGQFSHERAESNPQCVGYVIDIPLHGKMAYDLICQKMEFPQEWPEGLLMHVAGQTDNGWRTCSVWADREPSLVFLEQRLMPAAVDMVRERGLFPEIRPLEVKPFLFALNARMLG
jgi:hypothetical protein